MAKLYYRYGVMGSSKTANALMTMFNYQQKGYNVLLLKPSIDNRDIKIKSRIGLEADCITFNSNDNLLDLIKHKAPDCVIIDECQFATIEQIEQLKDATESVNIPVFCYGLRTDYMSNLFEASKRLFEIADSISEIKSICICGNKAIINARYIGDKIIYSGNQIDIGGNDMYVGLCYSCWKKGNLI